jgi:large subunit ribosomal protein L15
MQLHQLPSVGKKAQKRLGQGHGSGRGKTAGRGTKGQKARRTIPLYFEGGALPLIKRLPFHRGKGKNKSFKNKPFAVTVGQLSRIPAETTVDIETLIKHHVVAERARIDGVKIIGSGEVTHALTVSLPATKGAAEKITKAGGSIATSA